MVKIEFVGMTKRFDFDATTLTSVTGGRSVIDLPHLAIQTESQAEAFISAYGFNLNDSKDLSRLWYFYRRALVLIEERLGFRLDEIPEILRDRKNFDDPRKLILWASSLDPRDQDLQRWSCAILRAIHVFVHAENDLFGSFSEEIQKQILGPLQASIFTEGTTGTTFLKAPIAANLIGEEEIALAGFEIKPFKTSSSTVIKLLAKSNAVAMNVMDRLGVRFVTRSVFDTFRVLRFLLEHSLVSFPHIIPEQSSNSLYPADLFCQVMKDIQSEGGAWSDEDIARILEEKLVALGADAGWVRNDNSFSGKDYRFIKFISRKLITIPARENGESFSFFFPYEVQILDLESMDRIQSGPSEHQKYKERQRLAARKRLMPDLESLQ